jgi:hypothetical protein
MRTWRFQRGDVPIGCLVGMVVVLIVVLVGIKVTPLVINVGELDKEIAVLADRANRREYNDPRILADILQKAEALDLPVTKKDVTIKRSSKHIKITVIYDIPIKFPGGYTYVWHKEHFQDRPLIKF